LTKSGVHDYVANTTHFRFSCCHANLTVLIWLLS